MRQLVRKHRTWFQRYLTDAFVRAGHLNPASAAGHFTLMRDGAIIQRYSSDPATAGDVLQRGVEGAIRTIQ